MSIFENGFVLINKDIKYTKIFNSLDYMWLLVYFSINASYYDKEYIINWQTIFIEKWGLVYSQFWLSQHFGISIGKINKMIKTLEKIWLCENKNTNKFSYLKLKDDFIFMQAWKQNESKMKAKWNIQIINNKDNNIYIENYFEKITWIREELKNDYDLTIENFKLSFDNYINIRDSKNTYYSHIFTLNQFLKSKKGYLHFLNAKIDDYIDGRKMGEIEFDKTQERRKNIIQSQKIEEFEEEKRIENIKNWLHEKKKELWQEKIETMTKSIIDDYIKKNRVYTNAIIIATLNTNIKNIYNCPY